MKKLIVNLGKAEDRREVWETTLANAGASVKDATVESLRAQITEMLAYVELRVQQRAASYNLDLARECDSVLQGLRAIAAKGV